MEGYIIGRASSALSHTANGGGPSPGGDSALGQWAKILTILLGVGGAAYFLHKYYRDSQFRSYIQSLLPKSTLQKDDSTPTTSVPTDEAAIKAAATVAGLATVENIPEEGGLAATLRQGFSSLAAMIDRKSAYLEQLENDEQKKDTPSSSSASSSKEGTSTPVDDFDKGALKDSDILSSYFPHLAHPEQTEWPTWLEQITCAIQEEVNKLLAYLDKPIDFATDIGSSTFSTSSTTSVTTSQIADALVSAGVMSSSPSSSVIESLPEVPLIADKATLSDSQIRSTAEGIFVLARVLLRQHFHHLLLRPESMPVPLMETISPAQQEEMKVQEELQRQQRRQLRKTQKRNKLSSENPLQDTSASSISGTVSASKDEIHMDDVVINILQQTVPKEIGYWCASQDCFSTAEWFLEEGFDWLPQGTEPVEALKYLRTLLERIFASHSHLELHDPSVVGHTHKSNSAAKAAQLEEEETHNKLVRANQLATKRGLHLLELLLAREDYYDFNNLPVSKLDQPTHSSFDCGMEIISWLLTGLMTSPECTGAYPPRVSSKNKLDSSLLKNQVQAEDFVDPIWVEGALGLLMDKGASVMGTKSWLHPTLSSLPYHGSLGIYGLSDLQSGFVSPVLLTWLRTLANANNASLSSFPEIKEMFRRSDGLTAVDILLLRGQNEPEMWKREWQKLSLMLLAAMPDDRAKALNTIPPFSSAFSSGTFSGYNAGSSINSSAVSLGKVSADWLGVPLDLEERIASFCQQYLDPFTAYSAFSLDCLEDPWVNEDKAMEAWHKLLNEIVPAVISPQDDHEDDNMESQSARDNLLFWKEMTPSELGWLRHMVRWCLVKQFYRLAYVLLRMGLPGEFYSIEEEEKLRGLDGPSSFSSARDVGSSNRYRYVGSNLQLLLWQMFQPVTFRHSRQNQSGNAEGKDNEEPILQARIQLLEIMLQNGRYVLEILPYFDSSSDRGDSDFLQQQKRHNSLQGPPIVDVLQGLCLNSPYASQQKKRGHRRARLTTAVGHVSSDDLHRVLDVLTKNGLVSVNNSVFWWSFVPSSSTQSVDDLVPTFSACRGNVLHFCASQLQLNYLYPVLDFLCSGEDPLHKRQHKRHRRSRRNSLKGKDKDIASLSTTLTSDDCKKQLQWPEERNAWQLLESRPDVQMALQGRSRYIPQKWGKDLRQWLTPRPEEWELLSARQIRSFATPAASSVPHKKRGRKPRNKQQPQQQPGKLCVQEMTNYFSKAKKSLKEDSVASVGEDLVTSQFFDVAEGNVAVLSSSPESAEDLEASFVSIHTGLGTEEKIPLSEISLRPHSTLMDNLAQENEEKKEQPRSNVPTFIPGTPQQQQQQQQQQIEQAVQLPSVTELPSPLPQPPPIVDDSAVLPNPEPDVVTEFTKVQVLEELPVMEEEAVPPEVNEEPIPPLDDKEEWPTVEEAKHLTEEEQQPQHLQQQIPSSFSNIHEDYSPTASNQPNQSADQNLQVKVETTTVQVQTATFTTAESIVATSAAPLPNPIIKQYEIDEEVVSHLSSAEPEIIENFTKVVVVTKDDLVKEQLPSKENVEQAPLPDLKDKSAWPSLQETSSSEENAAIGGEKSQFSENR